MNGVTVKKADGSTVSINVVRYFKLNDFSYLIFSLNEIDDGGYVKLYISKIINGIGTTISDDVEWNLIKDTIKEIIKRNKEGISTGINDLNETELTNVTITDQKVFKLNDSLLQLLSANKNIINSISDDVIIEEPQLNVNTNIDNAQGQMISDLESKPNENLIPSYTSDSDVAEVSMKNVEIQTPKEEVQSVYYGEGNNENTNNIHQQNDFKALYEDELKKNEELFNELKRYQNLINDLKEVLK